MSNRDLLCGALVAATLVFTGPAAAEHRTLTGGGEADEPGAASPRTDQDAIDRGSIAPDPDEQRLVGRVMEVDREKGMIVLATEHGLVVVQATPKSLENVDVGDIIAVVVRPLAPPEHG